MTPERFETLAAAYGGDVARWPDAEREGAAELMAGRAAWASRILADAGDLDIALDAWVPSRGSPDLAARIAAGAPRGRARWIGWLLPAGMGVGLAAACAAGVMAGAQLNAVSSAPTASEADVLVTAVGEDDVALYLDEDA